MTKLIGWIRLVLFCTSVLELFCTNGWFVDWITVLKLGVRFDWFPWIFCSVKFCWFVWPWFVICWCVVWFVVFVELLVMVKSEWSNVILVGSAVVRFGAGFGRSPSEEKQTNKSKWNKRTKKAKNYLRDRSICKSFAFSSRRLRTVSSRSVSLKKSWNENEINKFIQQTNKCLSYRCYLVRPLIYDEEIR